MKIRVGFFAIMLMLSLLLSHSLFSLAAFFAALCHELGHFFAARLCKIKFKECKIGLFGAGLLPDEALFSYRHEISLCAAGPLSNLFLLIFLYPFYQKFPTEFLRYLLFSSLAFGVMNLLPIRDFDGGRILSVILSQHFSPRTVSLLLSCLSFIFIFFLWSLSVYFLLRFSASLSLFIFSISLFLRIFIPHS